MNYPKTITLKVNSDNTDDGSQLSAFAMASNFCTLFDVIEMNTDYYIETMHQAFNYIDHEFAMINAIKSGDWTPERKLTKENFDETLGLFKDEMQDALCDCLGDYSHMINPYAEILEKAYTEMDEYAYKEYLYGDRSHEGVLSRIEKFLIGDINVSLDYDEKEDVFTLTIDDNDAYEQLKEDYTATDIKDLQDSITDYIERRVIDELKKRKEERLKQAERWKKRQRIEREKEKARDERIDNLLNELNK